MKDFRPIGLCNVIIVTECLVNRLRPILSEIIGNTQSAFIPGRMITDNAIIAFECIQAIQKGSAANRKYCAFKLDLVKAYDPGDWGYLEKVSAKMDLLTNGYNGSCPVSRESGIFC